MLLYCVVIRALHNKAWGYGLVHRKKHINVYSQYRCCGIFSYFKYNVVLLQRCYYLLINAYVYLIVYTYLSGEVYVDDDFN